MVGSYIDIINAFTESLAPHVVDPQPVKSENFGKIQRGFS